MSTLKERWLALPKRTRSWITTGLKALVTVVAFYALFNHKIVVDGEKQTALRAILDYIPRIHARTFWTWIFVATAVKFTGVVGNMYRWHLLLRGQGIRFPFWHIVGTFMIGRFLGTFMPSTIGLDGYKLYDAYHYSREGVETTAATVIDKLLGFVGIFLTFLVALPLGYSVLGANTHWILPAVLVVSAVIVGFFLVLFKPGIIQFFLNLLPLPGKGKIHGIVDRINHAAAAYRDKKGTLFACAFFAFFGHFTTAAMYYFTALAIGALSAEFWTVTFASSIQIVATLVAPTLAGEGAREIAQALLLTKQIGAAQSIISAALGFWAAEAFTLAGVFFWWARRSGYTPRYLYLDGKKADLSVFRSEAEAPGRMEGFSFKTEFLKRVFACAGAGLLAGGLFGLIEAAVEAWTKAGTADPGVLAYGVLLYGIVGLAAGIGGGIGLGLISFLAERGKSPARIYAFFFAAWFSLNGLIIARFRVFRDVMHETAIPKWGLLLLVLGFFLIFLFLRWFVRILFQKPLRFACRLWGSALLFVLLFLGANLLRLAFPKEEKEAARAAPADSDRPNVILIMMDAQRADALSCYGYPKKTSPNIDRVAEEGVLFETAGAQATWTKPSTASILTSLYPSSHGATRKPDILPDGVVSLPEALKEGGYATAGFPNNINVAPIFNFGQGFDDYVYLAPDYYFGASETSSRLTYYNILRKIYEKIGAKRKYVRHYYQDADVVNGKAVGWLSEKGKAGPFFLFLHYMEPHDPYFVHPYDGVGYARVSMPNPDPALADTLLETYEGEIAFMDGKMGELFDWLKKNDLYDNTLIVLTADHGEEFYEHEGWWHGTTLYDEQMRVPLILKLPGGRKAGERIARPGRLIDVAPTVLHVAGILKPDKMQGRNLLDADYPEDLAVFSEEDHEGNVLKGLRTREWKLIRANEGNPRGLPPVQLFRISDDPKEMKDLSEEERERVAELEKRLSEAEKVAAGEAVERAETELDEATRERLKALGYIQ